MNTYTERPRAATQPTDSGTDIPLLQYPAGPGWKEPTTSLEAARAASKTAKNLRDQILRLLTVTPEPLSADQIAVRLKRSPFGIRPRVSELARLGKIKRTGDRAKNESGMSAHKWRAA